VVVDVVRYPGLAAEQLGLFLGLGHLGAGEQAARRDAVLDEGRVVGAAAEGGGYGGGVFALEEVFEVALEDVGACWAGQVERLAVAVVDAVDVVGAGDLLSTLG
jgi:hypothetical protein